MKEKLVENKWDYSLHAKFYEYRPNYSDRGIETLLHYIGYTPNNSDFKVADIGAGTGNLTVLLSKQGFHIDAVEPNDSMREIGVNRTSKDSNVIWHRANGIETGLSDKLYDWVAFGSSFNVMDRGEALKETHRILKDKGYFTCMWNHRDLNDLIQNSAEEIIVKHVPNYDRGVRRQEQRSVIEENSDLFKDIFYFEIDFNIARTIDEYINAWKSVKNKYWDLATEDGRKLFSDITENMKKDLPNNFEIKYTMRSWTAQKV